MLYGIFRKAILIIKNKLIINNKHIGKNERGKGVFRGNVWEDNENIEKLLVGGDRIPLKILSIEVHHGLEQVKSFRKGKRVDSSPSGN
jgi:hypothetical protein